MGATGGFFDSHSNIPCLNGSEDGLDSNTLLSVVTSREFRAFTVLVNVSFGVSGGVRHVERDVDESIDNVQ